jgi:hypothetical protein
MAGNKYEKKQKITAKCQEQMHKLIKMNNKKVG